MSNDSTVSVAALESSSWRFGDDALANAFGTSSVISGADSVVSASKSLSTPPTTKQEYSGILMGNGVSSILDFFVNAPSEEPKTSIPWYKRYSTILWSVVLVVIGLMLLSRGFGLIGEEGVEKIAMLEDPSKYPGIGHAVKAIRSRGGNKKKEGVEDE